MKKIIELFADPVWIFSSIIFSLLINILAAVIKDRIDSRAKAFLQAAKEEKAMRNELAKSYAEAINGRLDEQMYMHFHQLRALLFIILWTVGASILLAGSLQFAIEASWILASIFAIEGVVIFVWITIPQIRLYFYIDKILRHFVRGRDGDDAADENATLPNDHSSTP